MGFIVPPGGLSGYSQMTPASKVALGTPNWNQRGLKKTRRKKTRTASGRRRRSTGSARKGRTRARSTGRKLKFGSPAWQKKYKVGKYKK